MQKSNTSDMEQKELRLIPQTPLEFSGSKLVTSAYLVE
jgi:hypothetical protein